LLAELRAQPGLAGLPVALVSSEATLQARIAAARTGAAICLAGPLDEAALSACVQRLLQLAPDREPRITTILGDPACARRISELLGERGMSVTRFAEVGAALDSLATTATDLVIVDAAPAGAPGLDVCRLIRVTPGLHDLAILVLAAGDDSHGDAVVEALRAGADDCLPRGTAPAVLAEHVRAQVRRSQSLRERADRDAVTGLLQRQAFLDAASARLAEARRNGAPISLCLIDLDHLKSINDTHGHLAGDRALRSLGRLLQSRFRLEDLRGRWGGDEFVVLFPGQPASVVEGVIRRTLAEYCNLALEGSSGERFFASFSAGVACYPSEGGSLDALLRLADQRLYSAKQVRAAVVARGTGVPRMTSLQPKSA
jgi:diguanylate cyclase (GGDEF)-like protein